MADTWSLVTVKEFTYRDQAEEFSNRYYFNGTMPDTPLAWETLFNALNVEEKKIYSQDVIITRAYGYNAFQVPSIWTVDLKVSPRVPVTGTLAAGSAAPAPGDVAATVRWETGLLNSRGRKIYLRKYYHGVYIDSTDRDKLWPTQRTAIGGYANFLASASLPGGATLAGPHGVTGGVSLVNPYLTTRTLKRRGRRPTP